MSARKGKLYEVKHGRILWKYGPEGDRNPTIRTEINNSYHHQQQEEDYSLAMISDNEPVLFLEEFHDTSGDLRWVKVLYGDDMVYLECHFKSIGCLLKPISNEEEVTNSITSHHHQQQHYPLLL